MIQAIDEHTITDAVIDQMADTKNERLKEIIEAAVRNRHAFGREVDLTQDEWIQGIRFLTATGHACTEYCQESPTLKIGLPTREEGKGGSLKP